MKCKLFVYQYIYLINGHCLEAVMIEENNAGGGDCLYLAYSISLMYYLRSLDDKEVVDAILKKYDLKESELNTLTKLLDTPSKNHDGLFTKKQIKTIEKILGPKTRMLGSTQTAVEFERDPYETPLFTSSAYKIKGYIKEALAKHDRGLAGLIEKHNDFFSNYSKAEIYRVDGIDKAMRAYAEKFATHFVKTYRGPDIELPGKLEIAAHLKQSTVAPLFSHFESCWVKKMKVCMMSLLV